MELIIGVIWTLIIIILGMLLGRITKLSVLIFKELKKFFKKLY